MRITSFGYLVMQGWKNMLANRLMTIASIGVLTACLFITGIAALLSINVSNYVSFLGSQNEVEIYILDNEDDSSVISAEIAEGLRTQIEALENVATCEYISKEQALLEMSEYLGELSDVIAGYGTENNPMIPLPASFRASVVDLAHLTQTVEDIRTICADVVDRIDSPTNLSETLLSVENMASYVGWGLVAVLSIVSVVIISNTIRLTVFARRKEINIMKFVGATNAFIRLPFFVEGTTVGIIAGLISSALVGGGYYGLLYYSTLPEAAWLATFSAHFSPIEVILPYIVGGFIIFGVVIGSLGCASSIRKHLKV